MPPLREHLSKGHPPTSLWQLAAEPNHLVAYAFTVFLVLGSFCVVPYLADSMVANAGQRIEDMKYVYLVAGLFTLVSTNVVGRVADRYGKLRVFRITGLAAVATILLVTNLPPIPLWVAIAAATAFMVATSARMVPAMALVTRSAAPAVRGGFLSLNAAVQSAAMGLASLIGGALVGQTDDGRLRRLPGGRADRGGLRGGEFAIGGCAQVGGAGGGARAGERGGRGRGGGGGGMTSPPLSVSERGRGERSGGEARNEFGFSPPLRFGEGGGVGCTRFAAKTSGRKIANECRRRQPAVGSGVPARTVAAMSGHE